MVTKKAFWFVFSAIMSLSVILCSVQFIPTVKTRLQEFLLKNSREILGKVKGDLKGNGQILSFVKVLTSDGLSVEAYEINFRENEFNFLNRVVLTEKRDSHFHLKGLATNIALFDIDADGSLELLVPCLDENLIPRLHIYRFRLDTNTFEAINPESISL